MSEKLKNTSRFGISQFLQSKTGILVLLSVATFVILSPVLVLQRSTFFTNLDNVDQFYNWYQKFSMSLHSGYLPIWSANVFGGHSFAGEMQTGLFYPVNLLFVWLFGNANGISQQALEYLMALHFVIAAFGIYLVLKTLKVRTLAAFSAGLIFAFSSVLAIRAVSQTAIFFGLTLVPYPLYFLLKFHNDAKRRFRWLIFTGIALGMPILAGHVQPFFHALVILVILELALIVRDWRTIRKTYLKVFWQTGLRLGVILATAVVITLPQLWLTSQYLPNAYRIQAEGYLGPGQKIDYGHFAKSFSLNIHEFANLVNPGPYPIRDGNDIFMGLLPLALLILAAIFVRKQIKDSPAWQKYSRFITYLVVFSFIAMIGYWTWFAVILYELPFVYQVRQLGRYSILFHVGLTILLALAFEKIARFRPTKNQHLRILLMGIFLVINFGYVFLLRRFVFDAHFAAHCLITGLGLITIAVIQDFRWRAYALAALLGMTAMANTLWFLPKINAGTKLPQSYNLSPQLVEVLKQSNGQFRVEIQEDALPSNTGNIYPFQTVNGYGATMYAPFYEASRQQKVEPELLRDLLGVMYIVGKTKPTDKEIVYADEPGKIYIWKRPTALTKMYTVDQLGSEERSSYRPLNIKTLHYADHRQTFSVQVPTSGPVVVSELQYPGWQVIVDGQPAKWQVYEISHIRLLRTINLSQGEHLVEFQYKPFGF